MSSITKQEALDFAAKAIKKAERANSSTERQEQLNISDQWILLSQQLYVQSTPTYGWGQVPYTYTTVDPTSVTGQ